MVSTSSTTDQLDHRPDGRGRRPPPRPDGTLKVTGEFAYGSDLWMDDMLWGVTLRSPHPYARIRSVDLTEALKTAGVFAVLTHDDVPGSKYFGLEHQDQPVLAIDVVRYQGEPIALVAADHQTARQAAKKIVVEYDVLEPVVDADGRWSRTARCCTRAATWSGT